LYIDQAEELSAKLKSDWIEKYADNPRIEIHLSSISTHLNERKKIGDISEYQTHQIFRAMSAIHPNTRVVYICYPSPHLEEYQKSLEQSLCKKQSFLRPYINIELYSKLFPEFQGPH
jgi:hypothetical protein